MRACLTGQNAVPSSSRLETVLSTTWIMLKRVSEPRSREGEDTLSKIASLPVVHLDKLILGHVQAVPQLSRRLECLLEVVHKLTGSTAGSGLLRLLVVFFLSSKNNKHQQKSLSIVVAPLHSRATDKPTNQTANPVPSATRRIKREGFVDTSPAINNNRREYRGKQKDNSTEEVKRKRRRTSRGRRKRPLSRKRVSFVTYCVEERFYHCTCVAYEHDRKGLRLILTHGKRRQEKVQFPVSPIFGRKHMRGT